MALHQGVQYVEYRMDPVQTAQVLMYWADHHNDRGQALFDKNMDMDDVVAALHWALFKTGHRAMLTTPNPYDINPERLVEAVVELLVFLVPAWKSELTTEAILRPVAV